MTDPRLPLYDMPGFLIRLCHQISVGLFHEHCGDSGVTPIQFAVLSGVRWQPGLEQTQLSRLVGIDRTTTGGVLYRLEGRGLIRREADDKDRRIKRLFLTEEGLATVEAVAPQVGTVQNRIMEPLAADEQAQFMALMKKLVLGNTEGSRAPLDSEPSRNGRRS